MLRFYIYQILRHANPFLKRNQPIVGFVLVILAIRIYQHRTELEEIGIYIGCAILTYIAICITVPAITEMVEMERHKKYKRH